MNLLIYVAGWSLIHFVWQGAAIAIAAAVILRLVPAGAARLRYAVASAALAAMLAAPAATTAWLLSSPFAASLNDAAGATAVVTVTPAEVAPVPVASEDGDAVASALGHRTLLATVVAVWLSGVLLCLVRLAGGWWRIRRLHRASLAMDASPWQQTTTRLAATLRLRRIVRTVESEFVDTPTVLGWLRPVILLPAAALTNLSPAQLEAVLAHELAHVRRHDYAINLLQTAAETLLFYHPAVWWVSRIIRTEREHCCDDVAVNVCGNAADYAAALEELETWRVRQPALAMSAAAGPLLARVRRLLGVRTNDHRPSADLGAIAALVSVLVVISGAIQHLPARASEVREAVDWQLAETPHFQISFPPHLESEVPRVSSAAEEAYAQLMLDLRHDLAFKPMLVLFATRAEMERALRDGTIPGDVEHVLVPLDVPRERFRGDLIHEVTHVFSMDIIPRSRSDVPDWIHEGLADHQRGEWDANDAAALRDMVRTDTLPALATSGTAPPGMAPPGMAPPGGRNPRLNQIAGHAAFDFIVARAGKDGMRRFLMAVRQAPVGGVGSVYQVTFGLSAADFDRGVEEYVRARFQP